MKSVSLVFRCARRIFQIPFLLIAAALSASAAPLDNPQGELLVSGLLGSSGGTFGPDGYLYVTEGLPGRVTRIDPDTGASSVFATGLPPAVIGAGGAVDVAFIDGVAYVLVSLVGDPLFGSVSTDGVYRVDGYDSFTLIADLGSYSSSNPPDTNGGEWDYFLVNGVQYAMQTYRGGLLVTDGHHNRVLRVTVDGEISELIAFGNIVPTGLEVRGHQIFMAEAGPVPHLPQNGKIIAFDLDATGFVEVASGAPLAVDVEIGPANTLYALAQGQHAGGAAGSPAEPYTGKLLRVETDGSMTALAEGINQPTSMVIRGNTAFIINLSGEVWRYR